MDRPESTEGGPGTEPGRHRADRHPSPQMTLLLLRNTHWLTRGLEGLRPERWCHPLRLTWWGGGGATVSSDASISSVPAPNPGPLLCLAQDILGMRKKGNWAPALWLWDSEGLQLRGPCLAWHLGVHRAGGPASPLAVCITLSKSGYPSESQLPHL